ncbi:MAG: FHA domain-containing protein [Anaerolineae bacterium]
MFELITPSGEHHPLPQGITTLGREGCDVTLQDAQVSRRHAQIHRQGNRLTLQDLDSTNGTFVNGNRVTGTYQIQAGDQIYLGTTTLRVQQRAQGGAPTQVASPDQLPPEFHRQAAPDFAPSPPPPAWEAPSPPPPMAYAQPAPVQPSPYGQPQAVYSHPPKQRSTAMLLEIGPGLFGFLGFGWIYSGKTGTGITILIAYILTSLFFAVLGAITFGFSFFITVPIQIIAVIVSAVSLNSYTKQRTDLFGP